MDSRGANPVDPYHAIAGLYDLEHDPFQEDIDLILNFAGVAEGPILEMGCGSGRILAPLAEAGYTVVGFDTSTTMLDRARTRLAKAAPTGRAHLVEGDMADATQVPGGPFGLVMFTLNSLMHLPSPELQLAALANARRSLAAGGQILIDTVNPTPDYLVSLASAPALEWSAELDDGSMLDKWVFRTVHAVDQIIDTTVWYDQVGVAGELRRYRSQFELRFVHPNELSLMLSAAGFSDVRMYGGYELDPLDDSSDRILVTAEASPGEAGHHSQSHP
ncbi:MAG: class I SAM-dependent methyltransferase [Chloroflexia bacterium]|jgi:SAM-dependent methyltransferase|nr:class I SAM-dependent methyltransferase [Chloroflexia bacterium]